MSGMRRKTLLTLSVICKTFGDTVEPLHNDGLGFSSRRGKVARGRSVIKLSKIFKMFDCIGCSRRGQVSSFCHYDTQFITSAMQRFNELSRWLT